MATKFGKLKQDLPPVNGVQIILYSYVRSEDRSRKEYTATARISFQLPDELKPDADLKQLSNLRARIGPCRSFSQEVEKLERVVHTQEPSDSMLAIRGLANYHISFTHNIDFTTAQNLPNHPRIVVMRIEARYPKPSMISPEEFFFEQLKAGVDFGRISQKLIDLAREVQQEQAEVLKLARLTDQTQRVLEHLLPSAEKDADKEIGFSEKVKVMQKELREATKRIAMDQVKSVGLPDDFDPRCREAALVFLQEDNRYDNVGSNFCRSGYPYLSIEQVTKALGLEAKHG